MRPEEITALGELAGEAAGELTQRIGETHHAIAQRTFNAIGPAAAPVELVHDGIAGMVYGAVDLISRRGIKLAATALSAAVSAEAPALEEGRNGRRALAALNGVAGDRLHAERSPLQLSMTLRRDGDPVPAQPGPLSAAYPEATSRVAVLVHGLGQSEDAWRRGGHESPLGQRLQDELGVTPVLVRYNSGRPMADNGRDLAELLDELVSAWPVPLEDLTLVGHAIGALVCHRACELGRQRAWGGKVRHVITLGAPHRGTAMDKLVRSAGSALNLLPETRAAVKALEARSAGLKDAGRGTQDPFLTQARYLFISGSVFRDPERGFGRWLGDMFVSRDSAWAHAGNGQPVSFPPDSYRQIGGVGHFALTSHPMVADQIVRWLARQQLPAPRRALPPPQRP